MHISKYVAALSIASVAAAATRFAVYYDEWHQALPPKGGTAGITHVYTSFADPSLFTAVTPGPYAPFITSSALRASFDEDTKMCLAVGGWGLSAGYSAGYKTEELRALFAKNIAAALDTHGYECVDVDWEYPGGNGEDYITSPNEDKVGEVDGYPLLLRAIKDAIGEKELSITVPGLERDFIAFTAEKVPEINDDCHRRDTTTKHHSSVQGSLNTVEKYIELGMDPEKMNLGIGFYAKYFMTIEPCTQPIGCKTALLEYSGTDTGRSGAKTFGEGVPVLASGRADETEGGQWYWDPATSYFWTWDTPEFIAQKFEKIIKAKGVKAIQAGLQTL